jgi:hypothetical protein
MTCPDDLFQTAGYVCRSATGVCDVDEECSGASPDCPDDAWAENGLACDDGLFCTGNDACQDGQCAHSGDPCAAGETCDEAEQRCDPVGDDDAADDDATGDDDTGGGSDDAKRDGGPDHVTTFCGS